MIQCTLKACGSDHLIEMNNIVDHVHLLGPTIQSRACRAKPHAFSVHIDQ